MKKFILLLLLSVFWLTAKSQYTVTIDSTSCTPGTAVSVDIRLNNFAPKLINAFQFIIKYDSNYLQFVSASNWSAGITGVGVYSYYYAPIDSNVVTFVWGDTPVLVPSGGTFVRLNFNYRATALGCAPIRFDPVRITGCQIWEDGYIELLPISWNSGKICGCFPASVNLTSAAGTNNQTICSGSPITNVTYATTGATSATVSGLPTGVTGTWAADVVTISGTPTTTGTYNYTVSLNGGCSPVTTNGTITINPTNTITLATPGADAQTKCINTAIDNIGYTTTGATGATVTGLPAGVIGGWASNIVGITGSPTATGTFTYTVTLLGGCGALPTTGTIVVNPNNTITLTAGGTQTKCINTAITATTYTTTGATGATITGLPAGVTGSFASNVVTISGTPTVSGAFTYTVTLTGGCGTVTATGTITVTPNNTINLTSAAGTNAQTKCINTGITNITYATTTATGATVTGLPAGVSGTWASNVLTISGTPTAAGTYTYTVTLTGGCGIVSTTGTLTVTPNNTINLTSAAGTNAQTICINNAITSITYATTGATGASVTGLPAGVTGAWAANVVTISGTPTTSGTFNYTVTTTGGCTTPAVTATGTITVTPNNTITLTSGGAPSVCITNPIPNITYATTGATGATFTGLPSGVSGAWASNVVTISGTPTPAGTYTYTITLTGGCGNISTTGTISVVTSNTINLTSAAGTNAQTNCINTAITNITYATTGATGATVTGLPAGVTGTWATNTVTISGSPSVAGTFNYSVTLTGGCGTANATGTITVTPNNTVTAASATPSLCINTSLTPITHSTTGATGIGTATGLPANLSAEWVSNTITIHGTVIAAGTFNYSIPLTGGCGTVYATGTITVTPNNTVTAASATPTLCINTTLTPITHTTTGATGIGTATGLPAGLSAEWVSNTITIHGTPTATGTFNYTIPLTGGCGAASATGIITVNPNNTVTAASATPTLCINTVLPAITHTTTGATGIGTAAGLPAGVTAAWAANTITISGTPSAAGTFNYSIPLTGGCGIFAATGTITVTPDNTVTASTPVSTCINVAMTNITLTSTGATGIGTATGLPAGVTAAWASDIITISGTPTVSGVFNYDIPLTGGCGSVHATGTITVITENSVTTASSSPTLCINTPLTAITHTTTGATGIGTATGLPAGVSASWASNTITISGTPTASGAFTYSIPLTGGCGTVYATGTITVTPNNTITLTSAAGTNAQTICINTGIADIAYATTGATDATVTGLPTGVTGTWTSNIVTITGTPTVSGVYVYTVTLTGGCGNIATTGTINVSPANTLTLTSAPATAAQTVCVNTAITNVTATTTGATGATIDGLPTGVTGTWASNVITVSGTPTVTGVFIYTVTLNGGCGVIVQPAMITVTADNTITLSSAAGTDEQLICFGEAIVDVTYATTGATGADISGLPAGVTGTWAADVVTITGTPTTSGTYTYTVLLTGGCGAVSCTGIITISPELIVPDEVISINSGETFTVIPAAPAGTTYSWDTPTYTNDVSGGAAGSGTSVSGGPLTIPSGSGTAVYIVTPTSAQGCVGETFTVTVTVTQARVTELASAFSPDGNGQNDEFPSDYYTQTHKYTVEIFDRWGVMLYKGSEGWDGMYNGKMMPPATYYYKINLEGVDGTETKIGSITLVKN